MDTNCKVGSIRQINRQLQKEGYNVSEYALRRWVQDGIIPSVCSGSKRLITYAHVVQYLTTGSTLPIKQAASI